jgi:hypothetical protein
VVKCQCKIACDYKTLPILSKKYSSGLSFVTSGSGDMYGKYAGGGGGAWDKRMEYVLPLLRERMLVVWNIF